MAAWDGTLTITQSPSGKERMSSLFDLHDRVALVTGAGRGLGSGMSKALAAAGAQVVLASRSEDQLKTVAAEITAGGGTAGTLAWDLGDGGSAGDLVDEVVRRFGRLDIVVHAAGNMVREPAVNLSAEGWDSVIGLHLRGAFLLAQATARHLRENGRGGSIILVGSLTSQRAGIPATVAYGSAKSGLMGLMRTLAVEWAPDGIRVNLIAPGFFPTAMTATADDNPARRALLARVPMGRLGTPEDLGGTAVFLASDASGYITGEAITVDGGWSVA
jgi:NAD(P)-dependent dehydrogenase (short-subunit alcohol dehydrogenase family)